jgi:tetratricopeptide (TPR) repeat protein
VEAQQALDEAKKALAAVGDPANHRFELWEWAMLTGELNQKQNRLPEAEQRYKEALAIEKDRKDSAQAADSLNALGTLYFDMKETDLSRENLTKAIAMYRKDYKSASKNPDLQDAYGRAIANDSWLLSKIALSDHKPEEAARQCQVVFEFGKTLGENDPKVKECSRSTTTPSKIAQ